MDGFGEWMHMLVCFAFWVFVALLAALVLSIGGCIYMRAHFEADLKHLREVNEKREQPKNVRVFKPGEELPPELAPLTEAEFEELKRQLREAKKAGQL